MQVLIQKVGDLLLDSSKEESFDTDALISTCLVKGIDSFSKVNKIILACRNKPLTEAKMEDVGRELSRVLFYTAGLVNLLNLNMEIDEELIDACMEEFDPIYHQDAILCSISGITAITSIVEDLYVWHDEDEVNEPDPDAPKDDNKEFQITSIITCVYILCERLSLDFGNLAYNARLIDKP